MKNQNSVNIEREKERTTYDIEIIVYNRLNFFVVKINNLMIFFCKFLHSKLKIKFEFNVNEFILIEILFEIKKILPLIFYVYVYLVGQQSSYDFKNFFSYVQYLEE